MSWVQRETAITYALRSLARAVFGRRPLREGRVATAGIGSRIRIDRDRWGVPHIEAASDADAFFALGYCLGQDRGFQMETLLRAARGTVAALAGSDGVPIDRLSRRIGFHRAARAQLEVLDPTVRARLDAYARGVSAGIEPGLRRRPLELAMTLCAPSRWEACDALAVGKLIAFGLALNWELELARLRVLELDGEEALRAVDPSYPSWLTVVSPPAQPAGPVIDRLGAEVARLRRMAPVGGSNAWAIAPTRTKAGRALLANDPHVFPALPPLFYLAHLRTPDWGLAGATMPGLCGMATGHNGSTAWGVTNGAADCVDLFVEELGPDGVSVRETDGWTPCEVVEERIKVRGKRRPLVERVLLTPRGPVVSPAVEGGGPLFSMSAAFLEPRPIEGYLRLERVRGIAELREAFRAWPSAPVNIIAADATGSIGWQLAAELPRRRGGSFGLLPQLGWEADAIWEGWVGQEELPSLVDPAAAFIVSANNKPTADGDDEGAFLGVDWADGYRAQRLTEAIGGGDEWSVESCLALQLDQTSIPWRELRDSIVASAAHGGERTEKAAALLRDWDGIVAADSPAAAVFELMLAQLARNYASEWAPRGAAWALGRGSGPLAPHSFAAIRWTGHLSRLVREGGEDGIGPAGVAAALETAVACLERQAGEDSSAWAWGKVRQLILRHPLGERGPLRRLFDLGPVPCGGDASTPNSAPPAPLDPIGDPIFAPTLRAVMDVGSWDDSRWILAGGQSGNPFSPHYGDQFELWCRGEAIPIPWTAKAVREASRHSLELVPAEGGAEWI